MPISCLADELLDLTFKYLSGDRASLVAAALVSRNFLQVSQRTLYTAYRIKLPLEQIDREKPINRPLHPHAGHRNYPTSRQSARQQCSGALSSGALVTICTACQSRAVGV
ncbi:hypothetical protein FA15DRAFT_42037 [Coprinopsis marcescibilis]|uniref:F-box domain-containing protein n=1 Tax=Coprinopsis marcescibilis TaxID=230819 RepID=A0A5C3L6V9_COPMA|nr:hypothetical protein FA15DRAFT_42037 [Coprinopsis marcescibilis]